MPSRADSTPRDHELLCEHCGYGLDGLPPPTPTSLCPECGQPLSDSLSPTSRTPTPWERPELPPLTRLLQTTTQVIFHPSPFFRRMLTRTDTRSSRWFAFIHHWLSAYFFGIAAAAHLLLIQGLLHDFTSTLFTSLLLACLFTLPLFAIISFIRWLAGKLSTFESRYHGMRLPHIATTRALHYHAAHLLPVSLLTAALTLGYQLLLSTRRIPLYTSETAYLYTLSAWVILAALYLFLTYWTAMKRIMYANR